MAIINTLLSLVETSIFIAVVLTLVLKTRHFILNIRRKKVLSWFYFSPFNIMNSYNDESARAKKIQNIYSLIAIILLGFAAAIFVINR